MSTSQKIILAGAVAFAATATYFWLTSASITFDFSRQKADGNPLPAPNHQIDLGYYFVDGRYGDFRSEVNCYTNLYYAWAWRNYPTDQDWRPLMTQSLTNAVADGKRIQLNANQEQPTTSLDDVLNVAAPFWDHIVRIELADEPGWSRAETESRIATLRSKMQARGLADRPVGVVYTKTDVLTSNAIFASNMDWVGIEAYVDPPGSPNSQTNINNLTSYVNQAKARVPAGKQIVLVMQAYARNGAWTNIPTLVDLQIPTYLLAYNDPRVVAITMFSYGRPSGTREHPELKIPHQQIAERLGYNICGGGGGGGGGTPGDIDRDGDVDIFDFNRLVERFGWMGILPEDIDSNGIVNIFDYNILVVNFGT